MSPTPDPYTEDGLAVLLDGQPAFRRTQVVEWLARGVEDPADMTNLPKSLREVLAERLGRRPRVLTVSEADRGLTRKVLLECGDDDAAEAVESVLMLYPRTPERTARATVCISTQAGCAMGCPFCATGQIGFRRQLGVGETVRQVTVMQRLLAAGGGTGGQADAGSGAGAGPEAAGGSGPEADPEAAAGSGPEADPEAAAGSGPKADPEAAAGSGPEAAGGSDPEADARSVDAVLASGAPLPPGVPDHVTNVVFMGMGEPLANLDVTVEAIRWLHGPFGLSARSITVSTVGLVPGIERLQQLELPITLAVSLHAPDDDLRDDLVPVNRQHPLSELMGATRRYMEATNRRVTFEYVMIAGVNASVEQARTLRQLLKTHMPRGAAHVNLIPMNPTPAVPWRAPAVADQRAFADVLVEGGITATIRANRGNDIDAACGQLYANYQVASGRILPAAIGAAERIAQRP